MQRKHVVPKHVGSELSIKPKPSLSLLRATLHVAMSAGGSAIEQRGGEIWSLVIFEVCFIGEKQISFAILQAMSVKVRRGEYMAMMECENLRSCTYVAIEE
ncbi:hypothetical protein NC651_039721 [Populus alba x Populus x berolinensis]|nr:hypothetical protein NC651_039721 [Populus alba x Populus x berolinensis]